MSMWRSASYTDTGQQRRINEDAVLDHGSEGLWLVADGMGGHSHGDRASRLVADSLSRFRTSRLPGISKRRLIARLAECNRQLIEHARQQEVDVIGCTVALLHARRDHVLCSWSGDSRIYRQRGRQLTLLTRDHTQRSSVEDRDQLRYPVCRMAASSLLTGAIGGAPHIQLDHGWFGLQAGDAFLLCTDGLNKEVSDDEIRECLSGTDDGNQVMSVLAQFYQQRGARDNIGMIWLLREPD